MEGRRWSLRIPGSGLPKDMVHMLEEAELGQALSKTVVTCFESLSMKRMGRDAAAVNAPELLFPLPTVVDEIDETRVGYDAGIGVSFAKETNRVIDPEVCTEESGAGPSDPSSESVPIPVRIRILFRPLDFSISYNLHVGF